MNRKDNNCRCCFCCSCENNKNDWEWGYEKESKKCSCHKEKEFPKHCCQCEREKDFSKCGCSHDKFQNKNFNCGFDNKSKKENFCDCKKSNYGYEEYDQKNFGWY